MHLPLEILENILKYTDDLTILLFQLETNMLSNYFVEKYVNEDNVCKELDKRIKNINNSDLYIFLLQLPKNLQKYCVNNLNYNCGEIKQSLCLYGMSSELFESYELSSGLFDLSSKIELSDNFKEIIEREKNNVDIYSSNIEEILYLRKVKESKVKESKVKESKNISKIDFRDKHIDYEPINFMEIQKQYFENYSKNAIKSKNQIDFTR